MNMKFPEAPHFFDLDLRRNFLLFTEEKNLIFEKGFLHQIEIRTGIPRDKSKPRTSAPIVGPKGRRFIDSDTFLQV